MPAHLKTRTHPFWEPLWLSRAAYRDIAITTIFLNVLALAMPIFTRVVYDRVVPNFAEATLWVLFSGMLLVIGFEILFKTSRSMLTDRLSYAAAAGLEQQVQRKLLHIAPSLSQSHANQYFMTLHEIRDFFCQKLVPALVDAPFVLAFMLAIFLLSPLMALVPMVIGAIIVILQFAFHHVLQRELLQFQKSQLERQAQLQETLAGRETIRQLACYESFEKTWQDTTETCASQTASLMSWQATVAHLTAALVSFNALMLVAVGVYEIQESRLSIGGLIAVNILSGRVLAPLVALGGILSKWPYLRGQMQLVETFMSLPVETAASGEEPFRLAGALQTKQLTVQYPEHPLPALQDISFSLAKGEKLAIIGPSGAGKSTLLRALAAQLPPHSGTIRWDERDLAHLPPTALRQQLGVVEQYPFFFARSLRENLLMGLERSDNDILDTLEMVGMGRFVSAMGQGLDVMLAEGGSNLSGGERQCLAVARALLRRSPVMLMDEPTSMMDHMTEARVVASLRKACQHKTMVIVTHRTPLLALVDRIALVDGGKLARFGARDDVLRELNVHAAG